jgi:hypothetical protein
MSPERYVSESDFIGGTGDEDADAERLTRQSKPSWMWPITRMSRPGALAYWATIGPANTRADSSFWELAPWLGVEGLPTTLAFVAADLTLLPALHSLDSPRAAPLFARALAGNRQAPRVSARAWFGRFPETATLGLIPEVFGPVKDAQVADVALRWLRRHHQEAFLKALARYEPEVQAAVLASVSQLRGLPSKAPVLPALANPTLLPRPITPAGEAIDLEGLSDLLQLLAATPPEGGPWLEDVRATFTALSLARLARALFDAWMLAGAPPKERWALATLAFFPADDAAEELAEIAALLAPEGHSARAQELTATLGRMGTRRSLALVDKLARRVRSTAFRRRALEIFAEAADAAGLTEDELAERLVPDFGLGAGSVFPTDPPLRMALTSEGAALVDASGRPQKAWPTTSDQELGAQWKELKRRLKPLLRETWARLERAMMTGRRMSPEHFGEVYLIHPVLSLAARRLVWATWSANGEPRRTFHVDELGLRDRDDRQMILAPDDVIGCIHPTELSAVDLAKWRERIAAQPFEQLSRRALVVDESSLTTQATELENRTLSTPDVFGLEHEGWVRGSTEDGGHLRRLAWSLMGAAIVLDLNPGVNLGLPDSTPLHTIAQVDLQIGPAPTARVCSEVERTLFRLSERSAP